MRLFLLLSLAAMSRMSAALAAASNGETFRLKALIDSGEKIDVPDSKGFTPLHAAANGERNSARNNN